MSTFPVPNGCIAAIVTHLQMTAPTPTHAPAAGAPLAAPQPPRNGSALRRIATPQVDWYLRLYRAVGEDWLWATRLFLSQADLTAIIQHPKTAIYAICDGDREIGLIELDWREPPDCEIVFFGLIASELGQGLGRWAMAEVQRLAFGGGARRLWLHTCTLDHPGAVQFYQAQGFSAFKREIEIMEDPRLAGLTRRDAGAYHPILEPDP
jgi:GNAT superfamily N-acetyltransferase